MREEGFSGKQQTAEVNEEAKICTHWDTLGKDPINNNNTIKNNNGSSRMRRRTHSSCNRSGNICDKKNCDTNNVDSG